MNGSVFELKLCLALEFYTFLILDAVCFAVCIVAPAETALQNAFLLVWFCHHALLDWSNRSEHCSVIIL